MNNLSINITVEQRFKNTSSLRVVLNLNIQLYESEMHNLWGIARKVKQRFIKLIYNYFAFDSIHILQ